MLDVPEAAEGKPCVKVLLLLSLPTPEHIVIMKFMSMCRWVMQWAP